MLACTIEFRPFTLVVLLMEPNGKKMKKQGFLFQLQKIFWKSDGGKQTRGKSDSSGLAEAGVDTSH